jgi:hypothetical protein
VVASFHQLLAVTVALEDKIFLNTVVNGIIYAQFFWHNAKKGTIAYAKSALQFSHW